MLPLVTINVISSTVLFIITNFLYYFKGNRNLIPICKLLLNRTKEKVCRKTTDFFAADPVLFTINLSDFLLHSHLLCNFFCKILFLLFHSFTLFKTNKLLNRKISTCILCNLRNISSNCLLIVFSLNINLL